MIPKAEPRHTGEMSESKRGGAGPTAKYTPVPHKKHNTPQPLVEVVCE